MWGWDWVLVNEVEMNLGWVVIGIEIVVDLVWVFGVIGFWYFV